MSSTGMTVADALATAFDDWGLDALYGVSGANIEDLHDAVHRLNGGLRSIAARSPVQPAASVTGWCFLG